jgi:hypothetical protein
MVNSFSHNQIIYRHKYAFPYSNVVDLNIRYFEQI